MKLDNTLVPIIDSVTEDFNSKYRRDTGKELTSSQVLFIIDTYEKFITEAVIRNYTVHRLYFGKHINIDKVNLFRERELRSVSAQNKHKFDEDTMKLEIRKIRTEYRMIIDSILKTAGRAYNNPIAGIQEFYLTPPVKDYNDKKFDIKIRKVVDYKVPTYKKVKEMLNNLLNEL